MASGEPSHCTLSNTLLSVCSTLLSEIEGGKSQDLFGGSSQQPSGDPRCRSPMLQNQSYGPALSDFDDSFSMGSHIHGVETNRCREDRQDGVAQDVSDVSRNVSSSQPNWIQGSISYGQMKEISVEEHSRKLLVNQADDSSWHQVHPQTYTFGLNDHEENLVEDVDESGQYRNLVRQNPENLQSSSSGSVPVRRKRDQDTSSESSESSEPDSEHVDREEPPKSKAKFLCADCGKEFNYQRSYVEHCLLHTGERPFECKYCGKSFRQSSGLNLHERIHTGVKPYICHICDKTFAQRETLKTHIRCHTGEKPYKCSFCERRFNQRNSRNLHEKVHKNDRNFTCDDCGMTFRRKDALQVHQRGSGVKRKCKDCGKVCQTLCALKVHRLHVHNEMPHTCEICLASFSTKTKLEKHRPCDSGKETSFVCKKCGQTFRIIEELSSHDCSKVGMGSVKCDKCGEEFTKSKELNIHRCKLSKNETFLCIDCGIVFKTEKNLKRHAAVHDASEKDVGHLLNSVIGEGIHVGTSDLQTAEGPEKGSSHGQGIGEERKAVSGLQAVTGSGRKENEKHNAHDKDSVKNSDIKKIQLVHADLDSSNEAVKDTQNGNEKFLCQHCGKVFAFRRSYMAHVKTHKQSRPHVCTVCGMSFKSQAKLANHSRKHTGKKPFECSVCNKSFSTIYSLRDHSNIHTDAKPFKCRICDTSFSLRSNRYLHELTHENKKPFRCEDCGIGYSQKLNLVSHKQKARKMKKCAHCDAKFENRCALYVHQDASHCEEEHVCQGCDRRFCSASRLKGHLPCDPSLPCYYVCRYCKKSFDSKEHLGHHDCPNGGEEGGQRQEEVSDCQNVEGSEKGSSHFISSEESIDVDTKDEADRDCKTLVGSKKGSCHSISSEGNIDVDTKHKADKNCQTFVGSKKESYYDMSFEGGIDEGTKQEGDNDGQTVTGSKKGLRQLLNCEDGEGIRLETKQTAVIDPSTVSGSKKAACDPRSLTSSEKGSCNPMKFEGGEDRRTNQEAYPVGLNDQQENLEETFMRQSPESLQSSFSDDGSAWQPGDQDTFSESSEGSKLESEQTDTEDTYAEKQTESKLNFLCAVCGKEFKHQLTYNEHCLLHTGERPFECKYCGKSFRQSSGLNLHERIHKGVKPYVCHICDKAFARKETLKTHIRCHTGEKPFKCTFCDRRFNQRTSRNLHEKVHTNERNFYCEDCGTSFRRKDALQVHQRRSGVSRNCKDCGEVCRTLCALKVHRLHVHNNKPHTCEICLSSFSTKAKLEKHRPCEKGKETSFVCKKCGQTFKILQDLSSHYCCSKVSTSSAKCDQCAKEFANNKELKIHQCEHSSKDLFQCTECGMVFKTKKNLERHVSVHDVPERGSGDLLYSEGDQGIVQEQQAVFGPQNVQGSDNRDQESHEAQHDCDGDEGRCTEDKAVSDLQTVTCSESREDEKHPAWVKDNVLKCDKKYTELGQTDIDSSSNSGNDARNCNKRFTYTHCGRVFAYRQSYMAHVKTHKEGRPHTCTVCGMSFKSQAKLANHSREHTGKKPFECSVCNKSFSTIYSLRDHSNIHTDAKPFKCRICDTSFSLRSNRYLHELTHENKKPFRCENCGIGYSQKLGLLSHKQKARKMKKCAHCDGKFENRCSLYVHQDASHCDEEHVCEGCDRRFCSASRLKGHLPCDQSLPSYYVCRNCTKSFDRVEFLDGHICDRK